MLDVLAALRHRRFRRDLSPYLDGVLPGGRSRRLEEHLASCQACRRELAELRATIETLGSLPLAEVPRSFALAAAPAPVPRPRPAVGRLEFGLRLATAAAAFALAAVVIGDFVGLPGGGEQGEEPAALAPAREETPAAWPLVPGEAEEAAPEYYAPGATPIARGEPEKRAEEVTPSPQAAPAQSPQAMAVEPPSEGAAEAVAAEEGGGPSREEVLRWLEVGLGVGIGVLVVLWALARLRAGAGS